MKKNIIVMLSAMVLCSTQSLAIDLQDTLIATYTNNPAIKSSQQLFLQEIEEYYKAFSHFLPSVSAQISTTNGKQKTYTPASESIFGPDVSRALSITQNIFSGGQSVLGLKIAQAAFGISKAKLYKREQEILLGAIEAYLDICEAREKYNIAIDSLEFHKQNLNMAQERIKVGEATVTDLALANSNLASAEAVKSKQYAALVGSYAKFRSITGMEPEENMNFPDIPHDLPETQEQLKSIVSQTNLNLISAKYSLSQAKDSTKSAAAALLPTADLKLTAGKNYYNPESPNDVSRKNGFSYSTSVTVNIPIYTKGGAEYSNIRSSKKATRQALYGLENMESQIKADVINYWESFIASKDGIIYSEKAVEAQKLAMDGIKQEYSVGSKTMLDVLKSLEDLNKAKSEAVSLKKNYIITSYKLKDLMGQMTAIQLKLPVKYFNPEHEFKMVKHKIIGF